MVYVKNVNGKPLMPCSHAKTRHLLEQKKAVIVKRMPFTIQLKFSVTEYKQDITLGIDCGYNNIGLSACTSDKVLFEANGKVRNDIVSLMANRLSLRRSRRNRTTRYRQPKFDNRVHSKNKGWLAPSVEERIGQHIRMVEMIHSILPVSKIRVEVAAFDIQKIKNPDVKEEKYQQGEQLGFWNTREYVLFRDGHKCRHCNGKSKDAVLEVHHLVQRKNGGSDRPDNLITLCRTCHENYHEGLFELKKPKGFKGQTFMGVMRWTFYNRLKKLYLNVELTYGYITKSIRIENNLEKEHFVDARCVAQCPKAVSDGFVYKIVKARSHNRQIHKNAILSGGIRKKNQAPRKVFGFSLNDLVRFNEIECLIHGRRSSGSFDIRKPDGEKVHAGIACKKLQFVEHAKQYFIYKENLPIPPRCRP